MLMQFNRVPVGVSKLVQCWSNFGAICQVAIAGANGAGVQICRAARAPVHHLKQLEEEKKPGSHLDDLFDCEKICLERYGRLSTQLFVLEYKLDWSRNHFGEKLGYPVKSGCKRHQNQMQCKWGEGGGEGAPLLTAEICLSLFIRFY